MIPKPYKILLVIFWLGTHLGLAQTGPGGVGNTTTNRLWLKADGNVYSDAGVTVATDGVAVRQWNDHSGNNNNASQATLGNRPVYARNVINGQPALRFTGNTYIDPGALGIAGTGGFSYVIVFKDTSYTAGGMSDGAGDYLIDRTPATNELAGLKITNTNKYGFQKRTNAGGGLGGPVSATAVNTTNFHVIDYQRQRGTSYQLYLDGSLDASVADADGDLTPPVPRIGRHYNTANNGVKGYISELIIYNTHLNTAQLNIINTYLAAKYSLTIANDKYAYDSNHGHEVAGIGRENASNTHTAAMSGGILRISGASALGDLDYLLFGHDNTDVTSTWTSTETPSDKLGIQRLSREWRLDETGDVGTVDVTVDVATLPSLPVDHTLYALMVDSDGDFSSGASVYELTFSSGTEYTVNALTISDGDHVAIAAIEPLVQHTLSTSSDFEPNDAVVEVELNFITATDRTVDYDTSDGSAAAGSDYTSVTGGTATILSGTSSGSYTISITNDVTVEDSEDFEITLSNPSSGITLGSIVSHSYTIFDDDNSRKIYLDASSSSGDESVTGVSVSISINNIDGVNPTSVDYSVTGGTATGGATDFTLAAGTVTIAAGGSSGSFNVTINDDALYENNETIIITLSNPVNCNLDGVAPLGGTGFIVYTYTINDNDSSPVIQFTTATSSGSEAVSSVNFQIDLDAISGLNSTVSYAVSGTATGSGTDYTLSSGTFTIPAGSASGNLTATVVDDAVLELRETIVITISSPVNASLGTNTVHTYTILDDEFFGYTGPGGVGDASTNKLWLKADTGVFADAGSTMATDGNGVQQWQDLSGNANHANQATPANQPIYRTNIVNTQPAMNFTGDTYIDTGSPGIAGDGGFTYFVVVEATSYASGSTSDGSGDYIIDRTVDTNELASLKVANTNKYGFQKRDNSGGGLGGPVTTTNINTSAFQMVDYMRNRGSNYQVYLNSTLEGTLSDSDGDLTPAATRIGRHQSIASAGLKGYISELVIYNFGLNTAQRIIVDNYLSAKYGITISNDRYAYDTPGTYEHYVAGIGRETISSFHQDAQGPAIVRIYSPSSLDDGDYLLWGHDNADPMYGPRFIAWTDPPAGIDNAMHRTWRVDETGEVGTVSVSFDLTGYEVESGSHLRLLVDSDDGDFENATLYPVSSYTDSIATFENIDFSAGQWFTIGSTDEKTILPIELLSFEGQFITNRVDLKWVTVSEHDNDYFTLERKGRNAEWVILDSIQSAGDSDQLLTYVWSDWQPIDFAYYRLKQTDYDGKFTYSQSIVVMAEYLGLPAFKVYPVPAVNTLTLSGNINGMDGFSVFDPAGRDVTYLIEMLNHEPARIELDVSSLPNGIYFIRSSGAVRRFIKE